jgi:FkbM family methyltransferase
MSASPADLPVMGVRVAGDMTVAVPPRIDLLTPYVLLEQEDWFEDEIGFLRRCLAAGTRAIDIGANYGLYSLMLAGVAGDSGRVWSIEPASQTAAYLRKSAEINALDNLTVIQKALSNRPGTARLSTEANSELNSLTRSAAGESEEVEIATLDGLAGEQEWSRIDFLKLDAEGEEERIIEGAARFLRDENPLVMFEIRHVERLNLQLIDRLRAAGYEPYLLVPGLDVLVPFDPGAPTDGFRLNVFACKAERAKALERQGALARESPGVAKADAMTHYRAAHDPKNPAALRHAHLRAAFADPVWESRTDGYGLGSRARIARELGEREQAVNLLNAALKACFDGNAGDPDASRLPPVQAFDSIDPGNQQEAWLKAALLDGLVELSRFSTYFARGTPLEQPTLDRLEALKATGFLRAPMERRRQLLRVLTGAQGGPLPDPAVTKLAPDNLNPGLWGGK